MQHLPEGLHSSPGEGKTPDTDVKQFTRLPDSDHYIQKLESRLLKAKRSGKELTSKDMISVLQTARDDYMRHLLSGSTNGLTSLSDIDGDKEVSVSYIERKIFPEKNGVTYEELQHLLESDVLAKTSDEGSTELLNDNVDR